MEVSDELCGGCSEGPLVTSHGTVVPISDPSLRPPSFKSLSPSFWEHWGALHVLLLPTASRTLLSVVPAEVQVRPLTGQAQPGRECADWSDLSHPSASVRGGDPSPNQTPQTEQLRAVSPKETWALRKVDGCWASRNSRCALPFHTLFYLRSLRSTGWISIWEATIPMS